VKAATERGVAVVFAPGFGARAVAEAALTFMLALCKKLPYWDVQLKSGNWNSRFDSRPGDLDGATLGIIGLGRAGQSLAELGRAFRMNLLAYDPYVAPARAASLGVELLALHDVLRRADFLSIHAPLTHETVGLINRDRLAMLKRGAFLVNLSRGGLIENLDVLYEAMQSGHLAGVGLDVFDPAPPDAHHPIFSLPTCLTSPHALATTERAMHDIFESMAKDMAAVLSGTTPRFIVNPEVLERRVTGAS
jgi:phosphoglycerate dehydrogenase-like enzyme